MRTHSLLPLLSWSFAVAVAAQASTPALTPALTHGPLRGHVDASSLHVWARVDIAGEYTLELQPVDAATPVPALARASAAADHDLTLHFVVEGLSAATAYMLRLQCGDVVVHRSDVPWTTAIADDASAASIAFGSCASDQGFPEQPIWGRILARSPQALLLLGDTPYIDNAGVGTRRQRHQQFFAFPPVRAVLMAIPTWTTWDDHDYGANDVFGAQPGTENARGVFVDYHAHASYGDGARGIHTSFRRGPVEVFVLDTRSFADGEPSPLAPGERTLLGAGQLEWLQRGLRQSTATWKVLACGMVWNDGVRPGKKDCWGNWLPERDALFRWCGAQRIAGLVLVSGDVHRSRVILHPTKAVLGYDLPEFVTSPLAQNVIESNAVPTPGLVFDAGEAHSCLFLDATGNGAEATLRAVFTAGDGREFHTRVLTAAQLRAADAADGYRRLVAMLRGQLGDEFALPPSEYDHPDFGVGDSEVLRPDWLQVVKAARPALLAWQALASETRCRFAPTSEDPMASEFQHELFLGCSSLQMLGTADALQRMAEQDADGLVRACTTLLAMARHLHQEPGGMAWVLAGRAERAVGALQRRATVALGGDVGTRLRDVVRAHLAGRASLGAASAALRIETFRLFDASVRQMGLGGDGKAVVARRFAEPLRRQFVHEVTACFAILDGLGEQLTPAMRDALRAWSKEGRQRLADARTALRALDGGGEPAVAAAPLLALQLAVMLCPDLLRFCEEQAEVGALLRDVAR